MKMNPEYAGLVRLPLLHETEAEVMPPMRGLTHVTDFIRKEQERELIHGQTIHRGRRISLTFRKLAFA